MGSQQKLGSLLEQSACWYMIPPFYLTKFQQVRIEQAKVYGQYCIWQQEDFLFVKDFNAGFNCFRFEQLQAWCFIDEGSVLVLALADRDKIIIYELCATTNQLQAIRTIQTTSVVTHMEYSKDLFVSC